jgi:general stress protein YciG
MADRQQPSSISSSQRSDSGRGNLVEDRERASEAGRKGG